MKRIAYSGTGMARRFTKTQQCNRIQAHIVIIEH